MKTLSIREQFYRAFQTQRLIQWNYDNNRDAEFVQADRVALTLLRADRNAGVTEQVLSDAMAAVSDGQLSDGYYWTQPARYWAFTERTYERQIAEVCSNA